VSIKALGRADYQAIHPALDADLVEVLDFAQSVRARYSEGGTAPDSVKAQIDQARSLFDGPAS
jgi:argininosuccinate lyase